MSDSYAFPTNYSKGLDRARVLAVVVVLSLLLLHQVAFVREWSPIPLSAVALVGIVVLSLVSSVPFNKGLARGVISIAGVVLVAGFAQVTSVLLLGAGDADLFRLLNLGLLLVGFALLISRIGLSRTDLVVAWLVVLFGVSASMYAYMFVFLPTEVKAVGDGWKEILQGFGRFSQVVNYRGGVLRSAGFFGNSNHLGYFLLFGGLFVSYLRANGRIRLSLFIMLFLMFSFGISLSGSRASLAALFGFVFFVSLAYLLGRTFSVRITSFARFYIHLVPYGILAAAVLAERAGLIDTAGRVDIWMQLFEEWLTGGVVSSFLGIGFGAAHGELGGFTAHNLLLRILLENGIVGILLFHVGVFLVIRSVLGAHNGLGGEVIIRSRVVVIGMLLALLIHQSFEDMALWPNSFTAVWAAFLLSLGLGARLNKRSMIDPGGLVRR